MLIEAILLALHADLASGADREVLRGLAYIYFECWKASLEVKLLTA